MAMLLVLVGATASHVGRIQAQILRSQDFNTDPRWEGFRNRLLPSKGPITRQDFGYCATRHAGGAPAGEIGGWVQRSLTPARYSMPLPRELSLDDHLVASGKLAVTHNGGGSGVLMGWFHHSSRGWRTSNSLALRADGNGDTYWLFFEYGTQNGRTGGMGAFKGERYQNTPTAPFPADGTVHDWHLRYDPEANGGVGAVQFSVDDRAYRLALREADRDDGAVFDRFGIWNQETTGGRIEIWFDDLVVNGTAYTFDADPRWEGNGNRTEFAERVVRPYHDFGFVAQAKNGSNGGAAGGTVWRDERPSYYADRVGPLSLDDELYAEGTVRFVAAGADSAVYLGWFHSDSKRNHLQPEHEKRQRNYLAILLEGPSRVGHYFRPGYATAGGGGSSAEQGPILRTDKKPRSWSLQYDPESGGGRGAIVVTLDEQRQTLALDASDRKRGATFDRFGLFNVQSGGWHVEVYFDDLLYTAGRMRDAP